MSARHAIKNGLFLELVARASEENLHFSFKNDVLEKAIYGVGNKKSHN